MYPRNFFLPIFLLLFSSCANQLPPSGGADDKTPPRILSMFPRPDAVNFRGSSIRIRFDEYVDRRSFEENFLISPKPPGEINFDWSSDEVEIEFSKPLMKNKTYVVVIGNRLKDLRGGNSIGTPLTFAFSTGGKIDQGKISGRVLYKNFDRVKILAYLKSNQTPEKLDPEKNPPDYVIQAAPEGTFQFQYLPVGEYRIYALDDEDRNNLYDPQVDKISFAHEDYRIISDSQSIRNVNFILDDLSGKKSDALLIKTLTPDSTGFIYSNISDGQEDVSPSQRFYFYFNNSDLTKSDIVLNFYITDTLTGKKYNPVFNWLNDSLLEVFPVNKFDLQSHLKLMIDLRNTSRHSLYERSFRIAGKNSLGTLSGKIVSSDSISVPVYIYLLDNKDESVLYSQKVTDSVFTFDDIAEGDYVMAAFIDENDNGKYDRGRYFPFEPSERIGIYSKELKVKGGWNIENIFLEF